MLVSYKNLILELDAFFLGVKCMIYPFFVVVVRSNLTSYTFILPLFNHIKSSHKLDFKSVYNSVRRKLLFIMEERIKLNVDG
jgi:hypothetical protein